MKLQLVPARMGLTWVKLGMRTFFGQPLALSGLFFMFLAVMSVAGSIPVVGMSLALALLPACTLGLMAASKEAATGKFPMPVVFISAFRAGRQQRTLDKVFREGCEVLAAERSGRHPPDVTGILAQRVSGQLPGFRPFEILLSRILRWHAHRIDVKIIIVGFSEPQDGFVPT